MRDQPGSDNRRRSRTVHTVHAIEVQATHDGGCEPAPAPDHATEFDGRQSEWRDVKVNC
jgi:hypothetical protein